ncbi:MAG: hypothetical protein AAGH99_01175 [Planctomycetota bacterium]
MKALTQHNPSLVSPDVFPSGVRWKLDPIEKSKYCASWKSDNKIYAVHANSGSAQNAISYWFAHDLHCKKWDKEGLSHDQRITRLTCLIAGLGYRVIWTEGTPRKERSGKLEYADNDAKRRRVWICEETPKEEQEPTLWNRYFLIVKEQFEVLNSDPALDRNWENARHAAEKSWPPTVGGRRDGGASCPFCGKTYITEKPFKRHVKNCYGYPAIGRIG